MQAEGYLNFQSSVHKRAARCSIAALLGFSVVSALPAIVTAQSISLPASSGTQMSETEKQTGNISVPQPISGQSFAELSRTVDAELQSGDPFAAGMILGQIDPARIVDPTEFDAFIGLFEKTAEALLSRGQHFPDNAALTKSISLSTKLLTLIDKSREPGRLALVQIILGKALTTHGARFGDHPELDKGIATLRTASKAWGLHDSPERWASGQLELAQALIASARISETNEKFDESIAICQQVIDAQSHERLDLAVTKARSVMANALWQYGQRQGDISMFSQAIWYAQEALNATNKDMRPFEWATTLNYLANSNREYASYTGDSALLATAINQYAQSLSIRTRELYPVEWAQTQLDFGNALSRFSTPIPTTNETNPAVVAYKQSLLVRTKEDTPLEWAMSQNNLAATTYYLNQNDSIGDYKQNVNLFRAALEVTTREKSPRDWALFKINLSKEMIKIYNSGEQIRQQNFTREMDAAMRAQSDYPLEKSDEMHQLAIDKILKKFNNVDELIEAEKEIVDVLSLYTREKHPWLWLRASRQLADVVFTVAARTSSVRRFGEVVALYRQQQLLIQRQYDPASWAKIEHSIGRALNSIGAISNDTEKLRESEVAYLQAMEATPKNDVNSLERLNIELAGLRCQIGQTSKDEKTIALAVAQYEEVNKANRLAGLSGDAMSIDLAIKRCKGIPYVLSEADAKRMQELRAQGK